MKYQAVIFDLFGTLIPNFSEREFREVIRQMAVTLGVPVDSFWQLWKADFNSRALGLLPDLESQITDVCQRLSGESESLLAEAGVELKYMYGHMSHNSLLLLINQ